MLILPLWLSRHSNSSRIGADCLSHWQTHDSHLLPANYVPPTIFNPSQIHTSVKLAVPSVPLFTLSASYTCTYVRMCTRRPWIGLNLGYQHLPFQLTHHQTRHHPGPPVEQWHVQTCCRQLLPLERSIP